MRAGYAACMTINEQLQFSVLSAPVASLDRRTLSQAWYSALYGARERAGTDLRAKRSSGAPPRTFETARANARAVCVQPSRPSQARLPLATGDRTGLPAGSERRAARSILARKIERVFLQPKNRPHKASFSLEGDCGRVHVILQSHGAQAKLVAVCSPAARAHVAQALAQARYALALRGIDLQPDVREAPAC